MHAARYPVNPGCSNSLPDNPYCAATQVVPAYGMTKNQAIKWAGSASELARRLGIKRQAVQKWPPRKQIPALRVYQIRELQSQEAK